MASLPMQIEIDRLMNLIRGFGWEKTEERITNSEMIITIVKDIPKETPPVS